MFGSDFKPELEVCGKRFKKAIEAIIDSSMPPPNSPSTIRRKGHGRTLIDSGKLRNSIEARVEGNTLRVGIFNPEVAKYAQLVHDGTTKIPARPFISKAFDENESFLDDLENQMLERLDRLLD